MLIDGKKIDNKRFNELYGQLLEEFYRPMAIMFVDWDNLNPEGLDKVSAVIKANYELAEFVRKTPNTPNTCLLYTSPSPRD